MSGREFIASLIESLGWPVAVVALALLFRSKIADLLPSREVKRLKAGPFELEWERGISEAQAHLAYAPPPHAAYRPRENGFSEDAAAPEESAPVEEPLWEEDPVAEENVVREPHPPHEPVPSHGDPVGDLRILSRRSPAAAVLEGYHRVQDAFARRVFAVDGEQVATAELDAAALAQRARELDLVTDETVRAVAKLSALRNLAAHRADEVTLAQATEYLSLVGLVIGTIATWIRPDPPPGEG